MNCDLCKREDLLNKGEYPYLLHEFKHSWWLLGEHQYYKGYTVLLVKGHYREMTDLPTDIAHELMSELLIAHKSVQDYYSPHKMNLCSLGNVVDHLHWHLFPRYQDDPKLKNPPWLQMQEFDTKKISPSVAEEIILNWKTKFKG